MAGQPQLWLKSAIESASGLDAYPVECTDRTVEPPYVTYVRDGTESEPILDDDLGSDSGPDQFPALASFTVTVYADSNVEAWEQARDIYLALNRFRDLEASQIIESCYVIDKRDGELTYLEGREQPTWSVELDVEIRFIED